MSADVPSPSLLAATPASDATDVSLHDDVEAVNVLRRKCALTAATARSVRKRECVSSSVITSPETVGFAAVSTLAAAVSSEGVWSGSLRASFVASQQPPQRQSQRLSPLSLRAEVEPVVLAGNADGRGRSATSTRHEAVATVWTRTSVGSIVVDIDASARDAIRLERGRSGNVAEGIDRERSHAKGRLRVPAIVSVNDTRRNRSVPPSASPPPPKRQRHDLSSLFGQLSDEPCIGLDIAVEPTEHGQVEDVAVPDYSQVVKDFGVGSVTTASSEAMVCAICFECRPHVLLPCCGRRGASTGYCRECIDGLCAEPFFLGRCPTCREVLSSRNIEVPGLWAAGERAFRLRCVADPDVSMTMRLHAALVSSAAAAARRDRPDAFVRRFLDPKVETALVSAGCSIRCTWPHGVRFRLAKGRSADCSDVVVRNGDSVRVVEKVSDWVRGDRGWLPLFRSGTCHPLFELDWEVSMNELEVVRDLLGELRFGVGGAGERSTNFRS
eukprot:TRINITY_DN2717_c2_g1_i1.p1 TRINITY_DN2717_c2_g1~~TRINITY_DN2717_c2_g1_i1.p1  ORF type:complete len:498 (+),score=56.81 TRINITY_DN2717_c2_g1_i1:189-1682(+)